MALPAVSQVQSFHRTLAASGFKNMKSFSALGVHPEDIAAQTQLADVIRKIESGAIKPEYSPITELVYFFNSSGNREAVFKPGETRALDETFARRFSYKLGAPGSIVPSMISTFNFSTLPPVTAEVFNPAAFEMPDWSGSETSYASSSAEEEGSIVFEKDRHSAISCAEITEFPFARTELRSHRQVYFLPHIESRGEVVKPSDKLHFEGSLIGILEPWVNDEEVSRIEFVTSLLLAATIGARDVKKDSFNGRGNTIFDIEEIMAAVDGDSVFSKPSLHIPALSDERAMEPLSRVEIRLIKEMVENWDVRDLVRYARDQRMLYRLNEIESLEVSDDPEDPTIHRLAAFGLSCFLEESGREEELFPPISLGLDNLFADAQIAALEGRLVNLKSALTEMDGAFKHTGDLPSMNLWGLINIIDPAYEKIVTEIKAARGRMLSGEESLLRARDIRAFLVDAASEDVFVNALASQAGRVPLAPPRARASSVPDSILHQREEESPELVVRSLSVEADYLSNFNFTPRSPSLVEPKATLDGIEG